MNVKDAAQEAGSIVGLSEKTVRKYRNNFFPTNAASLRSSRESTSGTASTMMSS